MLLKVPIISKNASVKTCLKLNFLLIPHWVHMSISSGARGSKNLSFPFQRIIRTSKIVNLWNPPAPLLGGDKTYVPTTFFVGNLILYNFCLKHFSIKSVLLAAFSLKVNLLPHSSTLFIIHKF